MKTQPLLLHAPQKSKIVSRAQQRVPLNEASLRALRARSSFDFGAPKDEGLKNIKNAGAPRAKRARPAVRDFDGRSWPRALRILFVVFLAELAV